MKPDCLIVGAGLVGLTTALELRRRGFSVMLLDRGQPGREASWAGAGVLCPLRPWAYPPAVVRLALDGAARYPALADELHRATGIDPGYRQTGLLIRRPGAAEQVRASLATHPQAHAWLDAVAQQQLLPGLAADTHAPALWLPEVAQVRNPRLLKALLRRLAQLGVVIRAGSAVQALRTQRDRVVGVQTATGPLAAGAVVLAAGAWSEALLPPPALDPVQPVRGQMLLLRGGLLPTAMLLQDETYLVPRADGRLLVGSTTERVGFDLRITAAARNRLRRQAEALWPALTQARIERQWSGLRPGTASGLPQVGPHPAHPGLWLNIGHYRNGVAMAPATAALLAEQLDSAPGFG